jgi:hypothetical protein
VADELTPAAPVESPPPTPEPAPPAESRPEAPAEDRATFNRDLFAAMLEQSGPRRLAEKEDAEPGEAPLASERGREAREAREARRPRPEAPAAGEAPAPAPTGRYAGRYDTPEALETAYRELERARERAEGEKGKAQEIATRLERLLAATLQGQQVRQAHPAPEGEAPTGPMRPEADWKPAPPPMNLQEAVSVLRQEHERLGLADPEGDALKYARALGVVLSIDEQARQAFMGPIQHELQRRIAEQNQLEWLKNRFFQSYPDLQSIRLDRLRGVAVETESALRAQKPDLTGDDFIREWFDLTAREARATFRTTDGAIATPASAGRAAGAPRRPDTPRATGAPFAESPSPRAQEPVLTGQAFHLARVFGRGPA